MFFQKVYKSFWDDLPGVEDDEKELNAVLKNYQKRVVRNSEDVLKGLRKILQDFNQKKFERIHFHFSGRIYQFGMVLALILCTSKHSRFKTIPWGPWA